MATNVLKWPQMTYLDQKLIYKKGKTDRLVCFYFYLCFMKNNSPKERVLEAATLLFHQYGYNSTGINAVIEEAKVAKSSFYDHYKTKDDLAVAYLKARHDYWFIGLTAGVEKMRTVKERIIAAFTYIIEMNEKEGYRGCAFLNMLSELPEHKGKIYDVIHQHKTELQAYFKALVTDENRAFMLYMLFEAGLTESQVYQNSACVKKTIELLKQDLI